MRHVSQENVLCRESVGDEASVGDIKLREYLFAMFIEFLFVALGVLVYLYLVY